MVIFEFLINYFRIVVVVEGFGFVTFLDKKDALEAKRRMDKEIVDGRRLVVS